MVIPLQTDSSLLGPPPPPVVKALQGIRWCVVAMYSFVVLRLLQGDGIISAMGDLIPAVVGMYLLRDDPYFKNCSRCLQNFYSINQGGLACLRSFMVLCGMNGTFGLFRAFSVRTYRTDGGGYHSLLLMVRATVYLAACAVCCWAWKAVQHSRAGFLDDMADLEHDEYAFFEDGSTGEAMRHAMTMTHQGQQQSSWTPPTHQPRHQPLPAWQQPLSEDDPALRLAIQASMQQEGGGSVVNEEDALLMAAMHQQEQQLERLHRQQVVEEDRQIVQEQNAEYEESLAMDRARQQSEKEALEKAREEERRLQEEEERQRIEEAERLRLEEERKAEAARMLEEKRERLPVEPPAGQSGRVQLLFRLPSGRRCQRAFLSSDLVSSLYDFVDVEEPEMGENVYHLVTQVPRRVYKERSETLEAAGVESQSVFLAEIG